MTRVRAPHREVILAGSGGQGLVLSAVLLAEAAIVERRKVAQTQSYGIASRGGLSFAEVILDQYEVIFQQVRDPDCVLALTEEAMRRFESWADRGVPILYDSGLVAMRAGSGFHGYAFTETASNLGEVGSVNILALGTLVTHSGVVKSTSLEEVIRKRFAGGAMQRNLGVFAAGKHLANAGAQ